MNAQSVEGLPDLPGPLETSSSWPFSWACFFTAMLLFLSLGDDVTQTARMAPVFLSYLFHFLECWRFEKFKSIFPRPQEAPGCMPSPCHFYCPGPQRKQNDPAVPLFCHWGRQLTDLPTHRLMPEASWTFTMKYLILLSYLCVFSTTQATLWLS